MHMLSDQLLDTWKMRLILTLRLAHHADHWLHTAILLLSMQVLKALLHGPQQLVFLLIILQHCQDQLQ